MTPSPSGGRLRPRHLRTRVTLAASVIAFAIMSAAAVVMVAVQQRQLFDAVDVTLRESVVEISAELDVRPGRSDRDQKPNDRDGDGDGDLARRVNSSRRPVQLLDLSGAVVAASGALTDEPALVAVSAPAVPQGVSTGGATALSTVRGTDERYRVAATTVDNGLVLVVGYSLADVDKALTTQRRTLVVAIPLLSALLGLLIWLVVGRALRPVEAIRREVAAIRANALHRRVPVPANAIELARLAETMNDMLDRLDEAATRQQRFVSDAAHELRSPLAGIRGQLEVNLHHPDAPGRAESEREILAETVRMQELVDGLLLLARADSGQVTLPTVEVDLDDLVLEEADQLRRTTGLRVRLDRMSAARVHGDPASLRRVIRNLADNAARHARSTVSFELHERTDGIELVVADDGPGIARDRAETVFDRFTRLEESRQRDAGGSGLGLAICREIVEYHGGTITLASAAPDGARFVVRLPGV